MSLWLENYINNSLVVDSVQWNMLVKAATDNKVYVVPAFSHKENGAICAVLLSRTSRRKVT